MKHYILYNPLAGCGQHGEAVGKLAAALGECETFAVTEITDYAAFLSRLTAEDVLVLCGGDGTINRFINDTDGMDIPCEILYSAMGTGNDFLRDIGLSPDEPPFSIKPYISHLPTVEVKGKTYRFLNNVGFGIDGYCCEVGDALKETAPGKPVNYTSIAIKGLLFHYRPTAATVVVDGETHRYEKVWLAPTMNGRFYGGGMMATPNQDRNHPEGLLSVMLFHGGGRLSTLMAFPNIFKGTHVNNKKMVVIHEGRDITVTFDKPAAVQIDGETILGVTSYHAYACKQAAPAQATRAAATVS